MTANRYTVRLYWRATLEAQEDHNLDPRDDRRLRELLEEMVARKRGTLRLDLAEYRIDVHSAGGGHQHASCRIDGAGRTVVNR